MFPSHDPQASVELKGSTKTMRKMKQGDQIFLVAKVFSIGATGSIDLEAVVQFFNKT